MESPRTSDLKNTNKKLRWVGKMNRQLPSAFFLSLLSHNHSSFQYRWKDAVGAFAKGLPEVPVEDITGSCLSH